MFPKKYNFWIFMIMFLWLNNSCFAENGLSFLKIGAGSRAIAMGDAHTALANDAAAVYWNPAGLSNLDHGQLIFAHNKWFQDITHNFAAYAFQVKNNKFGLSFISTKVDGIEARSISSTEPLGEIEAHDIMLGLSYARSFSDNLDLGITVKYLYEKIYLETAFGVAADFGVKYKSPVTGLFLGAVIQNIGKMSKFKEESTKLPFILKGGLAYHLPANISKSIIFVADFIKIVNGSNHLNFGVEYEFKNILALRCGYVTGYEERGLQGGFGFKFSRYQLDYCNTPFKSNLGNTHQLSFIVNF